MATSPRKKREIAAREELILAAAARMLVEEGFGALTMDRVAEAVEYSKGTVYQHFSSKEDLLATLAVRNTERRYELFSRASAFEGTTRERMAAIGVAFDLLMRSYPEQCQAETIFHASHIKAKMSEQTADLHRDADRRCDGVVAGLIREAVESGDLVAESEETIVALYFGLWALSWGAYQIVESVAPHELAERGFADPLLHLQLNQERLLDGFGWKPLSSEHDFEITRERIRREIFAPELT
jgi:AcrR family transcriptional regulator